MEGRTDFGMNICFYPLCLGLSSYIITLIRNLIFVLLPLVMHLDLLKITLFWMGINAQHLWHIDSF